MDGKMEPGQVVKPGVQADERAPITPSDGNPSQNFIPESEELENIDYTSTERRPEYSDPFESDAEAVRWSASEFIEHQKTAIWFLVLGLITFVVALVVYFLTRDWFASIMVMLLAVIFGIGAARRPRVLDYAINSSGVDIGDKHYPYEDFRSFGIVKEGPVETIVLLPSKRWMPAINLYFAPEDSEKIINALGSFMPFEERYASLSDRFLNKIRF